MKTDKKIVTGNFITDIGDLIFKGVPVSNDFKSDDFAKENGFIHIVINSPEKTVKYGGVGFKTFTKPDLHDFRKETLEILYINALPVMYRIINK